jgi:hypothetical protein
MSSELSADLFEQIIAGLKGDNVAGRDKRAEPRVGLRKRTTIMLGLSDGGAESMLVWVRDLSRSGIGILHSKSVKPGTEFTIRLPRRDGGDVVITYVVKYCKLVGSKQFSVGGILKKVSSEGGSDEAPIVAVINSNLQHQEAHPKAKSA